MFGTSDNPGMSLVPAIGCDHAGTLAQLQWNALTVPSRLGCQLGHCLVPTLQAFADALRINKTVTTVDLSNNHIFGDNGLKARPPQRPRLSRRKRDLAHLCAIVETCDRTIRASCEGLGFHDISAPCRSLCSFYFHAAWICFVSWGSEQFFDVFCCVFGECAARALRSLFVVWIGRSTQLTLNFKVHLFFEIHYSLPPSGTSSSFWMGNEHAECLGIEKELQWVTLI